MAIVTLLRPPLLVPKWSDSACDASDRSRLSGRKPPPAGHTPGSSTASARTRSRLRRCSTTGCSPSACQREIVDRIQPDTMSSASAACSRRTGPNSPADPDGAPALSERPDRRRRRAHHRDARVHARLDARGRRLRARRRRRNIVDLATAVEHGTARRGSPGWCCAGQTAARDQPGRAADPKPRRHPAGRRGTSCRSRSISTTARLRRRPRPQHADARDARLPVPVHVLFEPRDVDDALVRARSRTGARRDPGVQARYGATNFDFYDLTAIVKRSWIIEFTKLILDRKMKFTWQLPSGTRSEAIDDEVCRLLYGRAAGT